MSFFCSFLPDIVGWRVSTLHWKSRLWKGPAPELPIHHFVSHSCARAVWTPSSKSDSFRLAVFYSCGPLSAPLGSGRTSGGCIACGTIKKDVITVPGISKEYVSNCWKIWTISAITYFWGMKVKNVGLWNPEGLKSNAVIIHYALHTYWFSVSGQ